MGTESGDKAPTIASDVALFGAKCKTPLWPPDPLISLTGARSRL